MLLSQTCAYNVKPYPVELIQMYVMQHIEKGNFAAVGFLDVDENIQKIIKKTIKSF